jgi:hypothetical protein
MSNSEQVLINLFSLQCQFIFLPNPTDNNRPYLEKIFGPVKIGCGQQACLSYRFLLFYRMFLLKEMRMRFNPILILSFMYSLLLLSCENPTNNQSRGRDTLYIIDSVYRYDTVHVPNGVAHYVLIRQVHIICDSIAQSNAYATDTIIRVDSVFGTLKNQTSFYYEFPKTLTGTQVSPNVTLLNYPIHIDTSKYAMRSATISAEFRTTAQSSSFWVDDANYPYLRWGEFDSQSPNKWISVNTIVESLIISQDIPIRIAIYKHSGSDTSQVRNVVITITCDDK